MENGEEILAPLFMPIPKFYSTLEETHSSRKKNEEGKNNKGVGLGLKFPPWEKWGKVMQSVSGDLAVTAPGMQMEQRKVKLGYAGLHISAEWFQKNSLCWKNS